ncbi:MAG: DNA polymerase III subunit delta [Myxococcota bacterium]|nr:DNA polymerase III subunit delta [Myxococcota bacterium]MDW8363902.1 DNA polymerase III subunit delta [Myxococcales bacterium]
MDATELLEALEEGRIAPVYVLVGPERFLVERAITRIRTLATRDGIRELNDDVLHGPQLRARGVIELARTAPMMGSRRCVLVRQADAMEDRELDALAEYVADPVASSVLVLQAERLDGRTRLARAARERDAWIECRPLQSRQLPAFVRTECQRRGNRIDADAAEALIAAVGNDLSALDDAIERLSLYVGPGERIDTAAVEACVSRASLDTIWTLVDAIGERDAGASLSAVASLLDAREPPLRILGMIARQLRIIARAGGALRQGASAAEAARRAGAPPFKAAALARSARAFGPQELRAAFRVVAEADLALKGGRRDGGLVLEHAVLSLCRGRSFSAAGSSRSAP